MKYAHAVFQMIAMILFLHWGAWFAAAWCAFWGGYSFVRAGQLDAEERK